MNILFYGCTSWSLWISVPRTVSSSIPYGHSSAWRQEGEILPSVQCSEAEVKLWPVQNMGHLWKMLAL
jgi:hypothetical protein